MSTVDPLAADELLQVVAQVQHFAPDPGACPGMRKHGGVELLGAEPGRPELEEHHGVGAAGQVREAVARQLPRTLGDVPALPVHGTGGMFHEHPGPVPREGAGEVGVHREQDVVVRPLGYEVVVVGHDVHFLAPFPVVRREAVGGHEVRGDGNVGREPADDVAFIDIALKEGVGGEAAEVQALGLVADAGREPGCINLVPFAVLLAPEEGAPGVVQLLQGAVAGLEPAAECGHGVVIVGVADRCAVLVVDMPQDQRGVRGIAAGQLFRDVGGGAAVLRRAGACHAPGSVAQRDTFAGNGTGLRILLPEPGRRGGRGRAKVHADPGIMQEVQKVVQPFEVILTFARFQQHPGEDADADQVDPGLLHQRDVLHPDLTGPLLRVVVPAIAKTGRGTGSQGAGMRSAVAAVRAAVR
jgi:hypothetical protein